MSTKPLTIPVWATDSSYPAGSEAFSATATKVVAVAGLIAQGWSPKQKPAAQGMNYWMNLVGAWFTYLDDTGVKTIVPEPIFASNWAWAGATIIDGTLQFKSTGVGYAEFCLSDHMRDGQTLKDLRLWLVGDGVVDVTAKVITVNYAVPITTVVSTVVSNNVPAGTTTFLDFTALNVVCGQLTNRIWLRVECSAANAEMLAIIMEWA